MKFNGLTNQGREYLAKVQANQSAITFKKIVIGDGRLDEHDNPAELTRLINKKTEKGIISKEQSGDIVTLLTYVDNVSLSEGYYPREIGIYIDDSGVEKLYYYMNDGDETSWIPPENYGPFKIELKLNIIASNADSVIVNNPAKTMYITKDYVDKELAKKEGKIDKKSGFNLDKSDTVEKDTDKLFTAQGAFALKESTEKAIAEETKKRDARDVAVLGMENNIFPLSTATKGKVYYHNQSNRFYICTQNYSGSTLSIPNGNFEELSVYTNRQRLDNLPEMIQAGTNAFDRPNVGDTFHIKFNKTFKEIPVVVVGKYGYYTSTLTKCDFSIFNVTTTGFDITIIDNASSHSPTIYWIALN